MDDYLNEQGYENYEEFLIHYGVGHLNGGHSGRYPWGSGDIPYQHGDGRGFFANRFMSRYDELKKAGFSDKEIFRQMGLSRPMVDADGNIKRDEKGEIIYKDVGGQTIRAMLQMANHDIRRQKVAQAEALMEKFNGNKSAVAREMGMINSKGQPQDTSVAKLLNEGSKLKMNQALNAADLLENELKSKPFLDVGTGVERDEKFGVEGISNNMKLEALEILKTRGYGVYNIRIPQQTNPGKYTTTMVLTKETTGDDKAMWRKVYKALEEGKIESVGDYYSSDGGKTFRKWTFPTSLDSSRIGVVYAEDGGKARDGLVLIRPGVEDVSLGNDLYSQVRIMVDNKSYIKGMAAYGTPEQFEKFPKNVDVIINSNKKKDADFYDGVLKPLKGEKEGPIGPNNPIDRENPFGSAIKEGAKGQRWYPEGAPANEQKLSVINKRAEEGDWGDWSNKLPSQFLSKQPEYMIKRQLDLTISQAKDDYNEILKLNNPTIKKYYLEKFASECDTAASDLSAAALPRQRYQVLLPVPSLKDNEVYAPNYKDGDTLALVRYPHGGTFEIPILRVNNKNKEALALMGKNAKDAIGINPVAAGRLSGADFDGDTAVVIPITKTTKVNSTKELDALKGFEPKEEYGSREVNGQLISNKTGQPFKRIAKGSVQTEMGKITNLIMDMTLRGAPFESPDGVDIAHAVRHSMTIIDAYKHKLDYKASEVDNNIAKIKSKYQSHNRLNPDGTVGEWTDTGASTIVSRAGAEIQVPERRGEPIINVPSNKHYDPSKPEGSLIYKTSDRSYTKYKERKDGSYSEKEVKATVKVNQMDIVSDARQLISPDRNEVEKMYANYANARKAMANEARKEMVATKERIFNSSAKDTYREEVASLTSKLNTALKNAPRERRAQVLAGATVKAKLEDNPGMTNAEKKKVKQKALELARDSVGSVKRRDRNIDITDREWDAIQAGAFSATNLRKILDNTDPDKLRARAMPKSTNGIDSAMQARIRSFKNAGWTNAEIAEKLDISASTVSKYIKG